MTDVELDALDALIAEKVMRWHSGTPWKPLPKSWYDEEGVPVEIISNWRPTRDVAQAIQAAEKWRSPGMRHWSLHSPSATLPMFSASIICQGRPHSWREDADAPALALCLALKAAVEGK